VSPNDKDEFQEIWRIERLGEADEGRGRDRGKSGKVEEEIELMDK
jgi:hypothetical protein